MGEAQGFFNIKNWRDSLNEKNSIQSTATIIALNHYEFYLGFTALVPLFREVKRGKSFYFATNSI